MNFIGEYTIDEKLCDDIIQYFELDTTQKFAGVSRDGLDLDTKDSTDTNLCEPLKSIYIKELQKCVERYIKTYEMCDKIVDRWTIVEDINIQRYNPGQWYKKWHCERGGSNRPEVYRYLVFMTYLNTVVDGGETDFLYQNTKVKPVKGRTLIWPVDWTHTHRGLPSFSETKYIVTGWFSFPGNHIH